MLWGTSVQLRTVSARQHVTDVWLKLRSYIRSLSVQRPLIAQTPAPTSRRGWRLTPPPLWSSPAATCPPLQRSFRARGRRSVEDLLVIEVQKADAVAASHTASENALLPRFGFGLHLDFGLVHERELRAVPAFAWARRVLRLVGARANL